MSRRDRPVRLRWWVSLLAVAVAATLLPAAPAGSAVVRYPWAVLESARVEGNRLVARGYAFDPDTTAPIDVLMAVDAVDTKLSLHRAAGFRPDVWAFWGRPFSGFTARSAALAPGPHVMCIAARNVGAGDPWRLFGCKYFTVGPSSPIGSVDRATSVGDQVTVAGWALDLDTPEPVTVRVRVDGVTRTQLVARAPRPDLLRPYPLTGPDHGFTADVPITPGPHTVCVVAVNRGPGTDRTIGCRRVTGYEVSPIGDLNSVGVTGGSLRVRGWAHDADAAGPSSVRIGLARPLQDVETVTVVADRPRPDVATFLGIRVETGFDVALPLDDPGPATVCIGVVNSGRGADRLLGCRALSVDDRRPVVQVDDVLPASGGVRVRGVAADPDGGPVTVDVVVDGIGRATVAAGPGFDVPVDGLAPGSHAVCVVARDVPGPAPGVRGDREVPCGSAVLGPGASMATTGAPTILGRVGPAVGHPLERIDRDAGLSVTLHDGSLLWLFGDSTERDPAGSLRYFVAGTAAWAPSGSPRTTTDAVDTGGAPFRFASPTGDWGQPCPPDGSDRVMWPLSAVAIPEAGRTRVVVYLENVCLAPDRELDGSQSRGLSVAEWVYDPVAAPPGGRAVTATVLENRLRDERTYGMAATLGPDGLVYAYSCDAPLGGGWPDEYGPCQVARVDPGDVHRPASYRYWNGGPPGVPASWVADESGAAPLVLPDQVQPVGEAVPLNPVASFTVRFDAAFGAWVMAYSPWPGFTDQVAVRIADRPTGPWSAPLSVRLPGCRDRWGGRVRACYAGTAQPVFSGPDRIGIGYYDHLVATGPARGEYRVATVGVARTP